jgi:hypothetical protein
MEIVDKWLFRTVCFLAFMASSSAFALSYLAWVGRWHEAIAAACVAVVSCGVGIIGALIGSR